MRDEIANLEGTNLAAFSTDNSSRICLVGQAAYDNASTKYYFTAGNAGEWTTRTTDWGYGNRTYKITTSGSGSNNSCNNYHGIRPFCNLSANTAVSTEPDASGVYTIVSY